MRESLGETRTLGIVKKKKRSFKNNNCFYFKGCRQLCFFVLFCLVFLISTSHQTAEKVLPVADFPWKGFSVSGDLKPVKNPVFMYPITFTMNTLLLRWTLKHCFYLFHIIIWLFVIIELPFDLPGVEIFGFSVSVSALVICTYKARALASIMSGNFC